MGIVISTGLATSPFFLVTGIIGIISFIFSVGTFIKVVWSNATTFMAARKEIHTLLTNLRQELLEERASLRTLKKNCRRRRKAQKGRDGGDMENTLDMELDEATIKTMGDAVRSLIKAFQDIERPFLEPGEEGIQQAGRRRAHRRGVSPSPYYAHSAYQSPDNRNEKRALNSDDEPDDEKYWPQRVNYSQLTIRRRISWLTRKSEAERLLEQLSRLQTRRIARQVSGVSMALYEYGGTLARMEDAVNRIDDRTHRIVGVRRAS